MIRRLLAGLAIAGVTALAAGPAAAQDLKEINFGIISTESSQNLKQDWQPLLDDMARKTGLKVNAFFSPDYAGVIEGMRFNKVHVAWFGNKSAMEAVDRASAEVFAQMVNADGSQGYNSVLLVHRDSPIKSVEDMLKNAKSLSFGNGDPNSTSGFLVPSYYVFAMNNVEAKSIFRVVRSANHETNALAVANKQVDVATNNTENLEKIQERFPEKFKEMRVIWTSPLIPLDPLVMRKDLPEAAKAKIKTFFYTYGQGGPKEKDNLMKLSKLSMFKESSNRQLIPIRQLELFREKTKLEADTAMAPADRQAKLTELNRKLADLNQQLAQK